MASERKYYSGTDGVILLNPSAGSPTIPNTGEVSGTVRGVEGRIRWQYYEAATVHEYTLTRTGGGWALRGILGLSDAFKLSQRPLTFVAPHKGGQWRWPIDSFVVEPNRMLVATLGPLEP